jgi:hypothetical protein
MTIKLGSVIIVLMSFFIAKISFETATAEKGADQAMLQNDRSAASIDLSYYNHLNKR